MIVLFELHSSVATRTVGCWHPSGLHSSSDELSGAAEALRKDRQAAEDDTKAYRCKRCDREVRSDLS
jgi:hypothetical protein